jgi:hypothetical protein
MLRSALLIVGAFVLMVASGAAATIGATSFSMSLGLKYHNNYEYYGKLPAMLLIPFAAIVGFVVPGIVIWRLHINRWRVSLRTLLIATTLVAVVLGLVVYFAN